MSSPKSDIPLKDSFLAHLAPLNQLQEIKQQHLLGPDPTEVKNQDLFFFADLPLFAVAERAAHFAKRSWKRRSPSNWDCRSGSPTGRAFPSGGARARFRMERRVASLQVDHIECSVGTCRFAPFHNLPRTHAHELHAHVHSGGKAVESVWFGARGAITSKRSCQSTQANWIVL